MLNWNDYQYLLAVEAAGSLAAAARRLSVSQPTVGRRLNALSEALGVQLVTLSSDGAQLSERGRKICEQARVLGQQAALIELTAREGKASEATRLRIAASEGFASVMLVGLFAEFQDLHPNIHIDLISGTRMSDLRHSEADVAIRVGDPIDDQLHGRIVGQIDFGLYAHHSYLDKGLPLATVADLQDHAIVESTGEIENLPQAKRLREMAPKAKVTFSSNSPLNQIDAMLSGFGILPLPTYRARNLPGAHRVLDTVFKMQTDIWLLYRASARERGEVQTVIDFLARELPKALKA
ncbi:MAG: LysR family transcriptional regulator [Pseudomonadota bacterium]